MHALSNGRYTTFMSNAGGGASRWEGLDLTRWRSDPTRDPWGQWTYLQDLDLGRSWSATPQPMGAPGQDERVLFHPPQVTFHRRDGDVDGRGGGDRRPIRRGRRVGSRLAGSRRRRRSDRRGKRH
jgi:cyclic beta-1,2-glucan synthetase